MFTYVIKTLCCKKRIFLFEKKIHRSHLNIFFCLPAISIGDMPSGLASSSRGFLMFLQTTRSIRRASKAQLPPSRATGAERKVSLSNTFRGASGGHVAEIGCDVPVVLLTVEDVVAAGLRGVVVLGEDPRQGPDDHRVNGEDVPQVFVQDRIFQEEPAGNPSAFGPSKVQPPRWFPAGLTLTKQSKPR